MGAWGMLLGVHPLFSTPRIGPLLVPKTGVVILKRARTYSNIVGDEAMTTNLYALLDRL